MMFNSELEHLGLREDKYELRDQEELLSFLSYTVLIKYTRICATVHLNKKDLVHKSGKDKKCTEKRLNT